MQNSLSFAESERNMGFEIEDKKKKPYFPPSVTKLTPNQAKQFVVDRTNSSEEGAEDFVESLRQQKKTKQNEQPLDDSQDEKWRRSA
jgi:hypothetical protein